jgi:hypothetical protein
MGERWNTEDCLGMALGIRRTIDSLIRKQEPTSESTQLLHEGIRFLDEAKAGRALISGVLDEAESFNGTFLPLCLAINVCVSFKNASPESGETDGEVGTLLTNYKNALEQIENKGLQSKIDQSTLDEIAGFFEALSNLLLQQADPLIKEYSRSYI